MQVLEDLYMGDIHPSERGFKKDSQYSKALNEVVKAGDAFIGTLTEKQKEQLEDYMTAQREVNVLTDCETFCYAFKLGAKVMMDVLTDGTMKEIYTICGARDNNSAGYPWLSLLGVYMNSLDL